MKNTKVTYKKIEEFTQGVHILFETNCTVNAEIGMEYMLAQGNCEKHAKVIAMEKARAAEKFGTDNGNGYFLIKEDKKEDFLAEESKINNKSVSVELPSIKISRNDLDGMKLPITFFKLMKDYIKE
jgi:hypothetical protein